PVDPFEDFDRVGGEAGAAGHLRFEAGALAGDRVAPELHRVDDPVALAFGVYVGGDDRRLAVLRADRADERGVVGGLAGDGGGGGAAARRAGRRDLFLLAAGFAAGRRGFAVGDHPLEPFRGHLADVRFDRFEVGRSEAGLAAEDDHRGGDFTVLKFFGGGQRLRRFGRLGEVGSRLVAFRVFELPRQVRR